MAAKEYKITLPNNKIEVVWANSAEQAARRAERKFCTGHVVTQRSYISNRTKNMTNVKGYEESDAMEEIDA